MLKYIDALQSCPTSTPGDLSTALVALPDDTARWLGLQIGATGVSSSTSVFASASISDISGRKFLTLKNRNFRSGFTGIQGYIFSSCALTSVSGTKAIFNFAFRVTPGVTSSFVQVFTWGTPAASNEDGSAANGLVLKADRTFRIGADVSTYVMPAGSTVYLELDFDLASHVVNVYANNTLILTSSNANIKSPFSSYLMNNASEYTNNIGATVDFSDILIMDDSGTDLNARLGPVQIDRLPLATQTTTNFSVTGAANAIAAIDNQDLSSASYAESPITNGAPDIFTVDASGVLSTDTIYGLVIKGQSFKSTAAGLRGLNLVLDDGGTVSKQAAGILSDVPSSPGVGFVIPKDKAAAAWTDTSLAAIKVGYEATLS